MFGATGWLFADLFVALTMAFLVANTVGQVVPRPKPHVPTPIARVTPTPTPSPTPEPGLDNQPITLDLHVDYQGLLRHDPAAILDAERQVRANPQLAGRRAGLVLSFGGAPPSNPHLGIQVAQALDDNVLKDLASLNYVFVSYTVYREFFNLGVSSSDIQVDVYVFKQ